MYQVEASCLALAKGMKGATESVGIAVAGAEGFRGLNSLGTRLTRSGALNPLWQVFPVSQR